MAAGQRGPANHRFALYLRFTLSYRHVEVLLAEPRLELSYENGAALGA